MMKTIHLTVILMVYCFTMCTPEKSPIDYGLDKCQFCKMTIVDKRFGCELVTTKGKVFKFDATECMVHFLDSDEVHKNDIAMLLTNTYDMPGQLIHVDHCYFLQSENMPSPMGKFINPFSEEILAMEFKESRSGSIYQWEELTNRLEKKINSLRKDVP